MLSDLIREKIKKKMKLSDKFIRIFLVKFNSGEIGPKMSRKFIAEFVFHDLNAFNTEISQK